MTKILIAMMCLVIGIGYVFTIEFFIAFGIAGVLIPLLFIDED